MLIFKTKREVFEFITTNAGKRIGFVPTMGALHQGHISLVRRSVAENDITAVSIFVNPIQFNNPADLEKYPRNIDSDIALLENAGVDLVFVPSVEEMYPDAPTETYDFGELGSVMEGAFRPGHFNGVAVVVRRLFDIVQPTKAYFGEKDYQQLLIIRELVKQINSHVEIIACPIDRENDGLARSSRNLRLTDEMRRTAPFIYQQLLKARSMAVNHTAQEIKEIIEKSFEEHPLLKLEYFTIADGQTLQSIDGAVPENAYAFVVAFAGDIRLIDNIRLI
jgi:pantoate--beta-alanine ligase